MEPYEVESFISELDNKVSELMQEKEELFLVIEQGIAVMETLKEQLED